MSLYSDYLSLKAEKTSGQFSVYVDDEKMSLASTGIIADTVRMKPDALLCLPSGSTPLGTFDMLCRMQEEGDISFARSRFMQLDEWLSLEDESENCQHFLEKHFYHRAGIRAGQIYCFNTHAADIREECLKADAYLEAEGPVDMMVLGIGMNGHLGLNEPGISWTLKTTEVVLSDTTRSVGQKYFSERTTLTRGMTLGMTHILASKHVLLQISGAHKADIARQLYTSGPDIRLPASALKTHSDAEILMDRGAASKICL